MLSLAAAKRFLNKTSAADDAEVQSMLDRALSVLGERVGPLLPVPVVDEVHTGPGPLVLRQSPVLSVTSVTSGGALVTDIDLDTDTGLLYGRFSSARRSVRVTYTAGRATVPPDLEAAVYELLGHLWESQRGGGAARPGFPGEDDDSETVGGSYLLPYRVRSLIEPHLLTPGFA